MSVLTQNQSQPLKRGLKYGLIAGFIYFLIAFVVNHETSLDQRLLSSSFHGALCALMTLFSTTLMETVFNSLNGHWKKYFGTIFFSAGLVLTLLTSVHWMIGTPEIFHTILASAVTSLPYYTLFPMNLLIEYDAKKDRLAYRRIEDWESKKWPVKYLSKPYTLGEFFRVFWKNIVGASKANPEKVQYESHQIQLAKETTNETTIENQNLKIAFLGDLMPTKGRKWVLSAELKEFFSGCDYLVANFEGTLYKDRPVFLAQNHDEAFLQDLAKIKDPSKIILSVANNHSADYGYDLFQKTCQRLEEIGFQVIGSRKKSQLIISEKINLAAATQWSNQHHGYLSFLEDADQLLAPDKLNLLFPHWGYEMDLYPRKDWVQLAKKLSTDWDCIVGHHSHVPGPVTTVPSPEGAKLVAYSLGDSSTAISLDSYRHGIALKVDIDLGHSSEEKAKILSAEWEFTKLKLEEDKSYTLEPCKICRIL